MQYDNRIHMYIMCLARSMFTQYPVDVSAWLPGKTWLRAAPVLGICLSFNEDNSEFPFAHVLLQCSLRRVPSVSRGRLDLYRGQELRVMGRINLSTEREGGWPMTFCSAARVQLAPAGWVALKKPQHSTCTYSSCAFEST
jgi:hypothetical protein